MKRALFKNNIILTDSESKSKKYVLSFKYRSIIDKIIIDKGVKYRNIGSNTDYLFAFSDEKDAYKASSGLFNFFILGWPSSALTKEVFLSDSQETYRLRINKKPRVFAKIKTQNNEICFFPILDKFFSLNIDKYRELLKIKDFQFKESKIEILEESVSNKELLKDSDEIILVLDLDIKKMALYDNNLNKRSNDFDYICTIQSKEKIQYYFGYNKIRVSSKSNQLSLHKIGKQFKDIDIFEDIQKKFLSSFSDMELFDLDTLFLSIEKKFNIPENEILKIFDSFIAKRAIGSITRRKKNKIL